MVELDICILADLSRLDRRSAFFNESAPSNSSEH